jgi:putative DNA primase/helicase
MDRLILPPPDEPMRVARAITNQRYTRDGVLVLRHWRGAWWEWSTSQWVEREHRDIRAQAYLITEHALITYDLEEDASKKKKRDKASEALWQELEEEMGDEFAELAKLLEGLGLARWQPNRNKITNLLEALAAVCHLSEVVNQPAWIDMPDDHGVIVSCANGLLDVTTKTLHPHTPRFFNQTAVPFNFEPEAPRPERWLAFLNELWPEDADSIAALQEWFGYVISGRLDLHKIMLLVVQPERARVSLLESWARWWAGTTLRDRRSTACRMTSGWRRSSASPSRSSPMRV